MSDKPKEKKAEAAPAADAHNAEKKKAGIVGMLTKLPVLLAVVMVVEGVAVFFGAHYLGASPKAAEGATLQAKSEDADDAEEAAPAAGGKAAEGGKGAVEAKRPKGKYDLPVIEFRAPNKVSGKMFLYDVSIEVQVLGKNFDLVQKKLDQRKGLISDRVRTIIAQSDPEKLNGQAEPGLETLKRQVKYQLDEMVGPEMIEEVLIRRCIPFRADF